MLIMSVGLRVVTLDTRVYFSANRCDFRSAAVLASRNPQVPSQPPRNHSHFISKELRSCDALRDRSGPDSGVWLRENAIKIPKSPGNGVTPFSTISAACRSARASSPQKMPFFSPLSRLKRIIIWQRQKVAGGFFSIKHYFGPPQRPELLHLGGDENLFLSLSQSEQLLPLNISRFKCKTGVE